MHIISNLVSRRLRKVATSLVCVKIMIMTKYLNATMKSLGVFFFFWEFINFKVVTAYVIFCFI